MVYHSVRTAQMNWDVPSKWRAVLTDVIRVTAFLAASSVMERRTVGMAAMKQAVVCFHRIRK